MDSNASLNITGSTNFAAAAPSTTVRIYVDNVLTETGIGGTSATASHIL